MAENEHNYNKFNNYLNSIPLEELHAKNQKDLDKAQKNFQELKKALAQGKCSFCGNELSYFSEKKPCFHWLLKPNGFKKRHFPLLYTQENFHQLEAYLRWVANCEAPMVNINDLVEEKSSSKIIEETICYKNLEWSFSCTENCMRGDSHKSKDGEKIPHYHFQMRVDGNVIINYNGFHVPFHDYDHFCFAVKRGEFDRLRGHHVEGAGMQALLDNFTPEELIDHMQKPPDDAGRKQQFHLGTLVVADEGTTMSGDDIADIIEEHNRTGVPMAKLIRKLKNVNVETIISPGPDVPKIAARKPNRGKPPKS